MTLELTDRELTALYNALVSATEDLEDDMATWFEEEDYDAELATRRALVDRVWAILNDGKDAPEAAQP